MILLENGCLVFKLNLKKKKKSSIDLNTLRKIKNTKKKQDQVNV